MIHECSGCKCQEESCSTLKHGMNPINIIYPECPCSICLIKGICDETCYAYDEHVDILYKLKREYRNV